MVRNDEPSSRDPAFGGIPLVGGTSPGVVRIGPTIHRPPAPGAPFVRRLLTDLEAVGFGGAPRYLGTDDDGREVFGYIEGEVVHAGVLSDVRIASAARLVRAYHEATATLTLRDGQEIVAHTDLGPHNTVFQGETAMALIDWDDARPGARLPDVGHAAWCFAEIGDGGGRPAMQGARLRVFCEAYGWDDAGELLDEIADRFRRAIAEHRGAGRAAAVAIFEEMAGWLQVHRPEIEQGLEGTS